MPRKASFTKQNSAKNPSVRAGFWVQQGSGSSAYRAFVPKPLPPDPPLRVEAETQRLLERACFAVGRLDGIGRLLPGPDELLYSYVRKEAVLSSQIEGTQSSLADLLLHESSAAPGVPLDDVREVSNYIAALNHGLDLLKTLPLSLRLIRELHRFLVQGTRGEYHAPGEFRRSQNWIGGTMPGNAYFVPPPPHELMPALDNLEKFLHSVELPALLKAGLAHAQFETIHPFLDGNGRVGRMLIPLMLVAENALERPWLYVSLHFKRNRLQYYDLLQRVRTHGAWEEWIAFYLDGVAVVAEQATNTIRKLLTLFEQDRAAIERSRAGSTYQRVAVHSDLEVYEHLRRRVAITVPETAKACNSTKPTVTRAIEDLERLGIVKEITGKARGRVYLYRAYLDILNEET